MTPKEVPVDPLRVLGSRREKHSCIKIFGEDVDRGIHRFFSSVLLLGRFVNS